MCLCSFRPNASEDTFSLGALLRTTSALASPAWESHLPAGARRCPGTILQLFANPILLIPLNRLQKLVPPGSLPQATVTWVMQPCCNKFGFIQSHLGELKDLEREIIFPFSSLLFLFYFLKDFLNLFLEKGEGREKERERSIDMTRET